MASADVPTTATTSTTEARERRSLLPAREIRTFRVGLPRLWKAMILTSFVLNLVLFAVVIFLGAFVFMYRGSIIATTQVAQGFARSNVTELQDVVQQLEGATIRTTIPLSQPLPLEGAGVVVPVDQQTQVVLTQDVPLQLAGADIDLGAGNRLRAQNINLTLPAGTPLNIALKMNIPLDSVTIPVRLNVPVEIPLKDTELGPQFVRLGQIVDRLVTPASPLLGIERTAVPAEGEAAPTTAPESTETVPTTAPQ